MIRCLADNCVLALRESTVVMELADLVGVLAWLGRPRPGDDEATQMRRLECREYVELFGDAPAFVSPQAAVDVWTVLVERFTDDISTMLPDLQRELAELQAAVH